MTTIALLQSDIDILSGSINRRVRRDSAQDNAVKYLYRCWLWRHHPKEATERGIWNPLEGRAA